MSISRLLVFQWVLIVADLFLHSYAADVVHDTTDALRWTNYLDFRLEFDEDSKIFTRLYDNRDHSNKYKSPFWSSQFQDDNDLVLQILFGIQYLYILFDPKTYMENANYIQFVYCTIADRNDPPRKNMSLTIGRFATSISLREHAN